MSTAKAQVLKAKVLKLGMGVPLCTTLARIPDGIKGVLTWRRNVPASIA
jgi:hypothetical protein